MSSTVETDPTRYARRADLVARFGGWEICDLADEDGDGRDDAGRIDAVLADVSAQIDAALATAWDLPLAGPGPWPALTAVACDLARLRLFDEAAPDGVVARARAARKALSDLVAGESVLLSADGKPVPRREEALMSVCGSRPMIAIALGRAGGCS